MFLLDKMLPIFQVPVDCSVHPQIRTCKNTILCITELASLNHKLNTQKTERPFKASKLLEKIDKHTKPTKEIRKKKSPILEEWLTHREDNYMGPKKQKNKRQETFVKVCLEGGDL